MSTSDAVLLLCLLFEIVQTAFIVMIALFVYPLLRNFNEAVVVMKTLASIGRTTQQETKAATERLSKKADELTVVPKKVEEVKQVIETMPDKIVERVKETNNT